MYYLGWASGLQYYLIYLTGQSLRQTGKIGEPKDGLDMSICVFDHKQLCADFAGANNGLLLIRNHEITELKPIRNPVGIHLKEKPY